MTVKNKKILILVFLTGCVLLGYWLWLSLRPVAIVAVHEDGSHASVLVKTFPFTDRGKINWWLKNKDMLKKNITFLNHHPLAILLLFFGVLAMDTRKKANMIDAVLLI